MIRCILAALAIAGVAIAPEHSWRERGKPARASEVCTASQYGVGDGYHGRRTASGRIFDTMLPTP